MTNYFKCKNCNDEFKFVHKTGQNMYCPECGSLLVKIFKSINTNFLSPQETNESLENCIKNNKKELENLKKSSTDDFNGEK